MTRKSLQTALLVGLCTAAGAFIVSEFVPADRTPIAEANSRSAAEEYREAEGVSPMLQQLHSRLDDAIDAWASGRHSVAIAQIQDASADLQLAGERAQTEEIRLALDKAVQDLQELSVGIRDDKITELDQLRANAVEIYKRLEAATQDAKRAATSGPEAVDAPESAE